MLPDRPYETRRCTEGLALLVSAEFASSTELKKVSRLGMTSPTVGILLTYPEICEE